MAKAFEPYPANRWNEDASVQAMTYCEADDRQLGPGWYDRPAPPRVELNPEPIPEAVTITRQAGPGVATMGFDDQSLVEVPEPIVDSTLEVSEEEKIDWGIEKKAKKAKK